MKKLSIILTIAITAIAAFTSLNASYTSAASGEAIDPTGSNNVSKAGAIILADRAVDRVRPARAATECAWFADPAIFVDQSMTFDDSKTSSFSRRTSVDTAVGFDFLTYGDAVVGLMLSRGDLNAKIDATPDTDIESYVVSTYISKVVYENWIIGSTFSYGESDVDSYPAGFNHKETETKAVSPFVAYTGTYKENSYWSVTLLANYQDTIIESTAAAEPTNSQDSIDLSIRGKWAYDYNEKCTFNVLGAYTKFVQRDVGTAVQGVQGNLDENWVNLGAGLTIRPDEKWAIDLNVEMIAAHTGYHSVTPSLAATYSY